jgi:hypothetical protein
MYQPTSSPYPRAAMDLNTIQDKLTRQVSTSPPNQGPVKVDWPQPQLPGLPPRTASSVAELSATVDTLRRRSAQVYPPLGSPGANRSEVPPPTLHPAVALRRIQAMVDKINQLSAEQERAMAEIQGLRSGLLQSSSSAALTALGEGSIPALVFDRAAIAWANLDGRGDIVLSHRPVALSQGSTASQSPENQGGPSHSPSLGLELLFQEPVRLVRQTWLWLAQWQPRDRPPGPPQGKSSPSPRARLSGPKALLWVGGGILGRLGLNVVLTAVPSLWSVAVVAITAVTAYALYRATLASRPDAGLALRVFLAIAGLMLGGQLV